MRVDAFLKQTRLVKRRSLAKELCDEGAVSVNGRPVRAGRDLVVGDEITLNLRNRVLSVSVAEISERPVPTERARELYHLIRDERLPEGPEGQEEPAGEHGAAAPSGDGD